jgi:transcriptional regulator with XRE-family HTH domain
MADGDQDRLHGSAIGERLRVAREEKGLSLEDVARQTRIPVRHLEHIERGEWAALPAATYSVGFAKSYATVVGLDPAPIGTELRQELGLARTTSGPAAAYYEPADPARVPPRSVAIIAAALIVLLAVGYMVWRNGAVDDPSAEPQLVDTAPPQAPVQRQPQPQPAAAATGPVVLTAVEDVWLRIYEGNGGPALYQGTLKAGERYEVPMAAQAPQIRTGRANALRVTVGSTVMPPLGPPERTIANVSLRAADLAARAQSAPPAAVAPARAAVPAPAPTGR